MDTKHIIAWVKENNQKAYVPERFNKQKQPVGDPDCKLGCKRKRNRQVTEPQSAPAKQALQAKTPAIGEYYWGYGSDVVIVKVPEWGEFVLAEKTQTFDKPDVSYFFPLMQQTEHRLGFRPGIGAFDAAFTSTSSSIALKIRPLLPPCLSPKKAGTKAASTAQIDYLFVKPG